MKKLYVPLSSDNFRRMGQKKIVDELRKIEPYMVILSIGSYRTDEHEREKSLVTLRENVAMLSSEGFRTGAWIWSFMTSDSNSFIHITGPDKKASETEICPTDNAFVCFAQQYIIDLAKTGVDMILFDDDFRFGHIDCGGIGCFCENHIKDISDRLQKKVTQGTLKKKVLYGGANKYRDAWLASKGSSLENFAVKMREAVDKVSPKIRIGLCACMTTWDSDGTDSITLSRLLAGETKPFLRFIGAPYWANGQDFGNKLADTVELERMQAAWCVGQGIEVAAEGDCYPRPRYNCPANYLEIFDTALTADGKIESIMKYMFDYSASPDYEKGYIESHLKNRKLRDDIETIFSEKEDAGVAIFEHREKIRYADLTSGKNTADTQNLIFSHTSRFLCQFSVPVYYSENSKLLAVFGENIKYVTDIDKHDFILDASAAEYLKCHGTDIGALEIGDDLLYGREGLELYYPADDEYSKQQKGNIHPIKAILKDSCSVLLWYITESGKYPAAYTYESESGNRFLVFLFDCRFSDRNSSCNYLYQRALLKGLEEVYREKLPAVCPGNPDLYMLVRKKENQLAVGLFNCFADSVMYPSIQLSGNIHSVKFINCGGTYEGDTVHITDIAPYQISAFEAALS